MTGRVALECPGASGNPAIMSTLAATAAGHVVEGCSAGTFKSLLVKVAVVSVSGPVTAPVSGMVALIVQDTPNNGAVVPLTLALRATASPFWEDVQLNPPVIVPGLATNPMVGVIFGTKVSTTDSGPYF